MCELIFNTIEINNNGININELELTDSNLPQVNFKQSDCLKWTIFSSTLRINQYQEKNQHSHSLHVFNQYDMLL